MAKVKWFGCGFPPVAPDTKVRVWVWDGREEVCSEGPAHFWSWDWPTLDDDYRTSGDILAYEVVEDKAIMRDFDTGATRSSDAGKHDFEGYLSPLVIERFAEYMTQHRVQADGTTRASDNWQKGMPLDVYMKSGWRHFFDWWKAHRGHHIEYGIEETLCALIFNAQGYLHEVLKAKNGKAGN